jgi:hypothetical protein
MSSLTPSIPGVDPYMGVRSFQDLLDLNVRYLRGENVMTPYHFDSVDEETLPLLGGLIRINQAGFLSVEGQPARRDRGRGGWGYGASNYTDTHQVSYIVGFVPETVAERLARFLRRQPVYFDMYKIKPFSMMASNYPKNSYTLTRIRSTARLKDLSRVPWLQYTNHRPYPGPTELVESFLPSAETYRRYSRIAHILEEKCVHVTIACRQFGRGSVEDTLLNFFYKGHVLPVSLKNKCPADKVLNPATGRCVLRTGKIGRKILQK